MDIMLFGKVQRIAVAVRQLRGILCCAGINRPYCMNDILCFQPVALSDFCFAGAAAVQRAALRQQFRPCCPVDGTIHTAATQQTAIGRIHDAVTVQFGNITLHHLNLIFYFFRNHCKHLTF